MVRILDGAWARQILTQEAGDSGLDRAGFQVGLRVRGLPSVPWQKGFLAVEQPII
jgi:hypothetical protein